jgi:hypothetical protein
MSTKPYHIHNIHPIPSPFGVNIYIDESGDLGYPNGSKFFVFGAVIVKNHEDEKCCKTRIMRAKRKIWSDYKFAEVKSSNLHDNNREIVIKEILKGNYDFAYCLLRKDEVKQEFRSVFGLYNWLAAKLVEEIIFKYGFKSDVNVIMDKSLYGVQQHNFNQTMLGRNFDIFNKYQDLEVKIFHSNSKTEYGIQIADMVAGTVYRHYTKFNKNPTPEYNFFPQICEKTTVALDFFQGRKK